MSHPTDNPETCFAPAPTDPAHQRYLDNVSALWALDACLARRLEARDFDVQAAVLGADLPLQEPPEPLEEVDPESQFAFVVYGFGPHVLELFRRTGGADGEALITVFDSDLVHLRRQFLVEEWADLLTSHRVVLLDSCEPVRIFDRLSRFGPILGTGVTSITHLPAVERAPDFFVGARRAMDDFLTLTGITLATTLEHGRKTTLNIIRNLHAYATAPDLSRLKNSFAGFPAIIVAAGPSLRKNIHHLQRVGGRAVVIAVQTTLRPLLEAGITPHFVTALDHHEISTRFYEHLPADLPTELIAEPKVSPRVIEAWTAVPGRRLTLLGNDTAESLLRELRLGKTTLPAGATVAHLAFSLAEHLGCSTAILIGQDLGFSDGLAYVPGTSYDDVWRPETGRFCTYEMRQWEHIARDRAALRRVVDWRGVPTYTEQRLFSYLQQFERLFAETPIRVIDATQGGIRKAHTQPISLSQAIAECCRRTVPEVPRPSEGQAPGGQSIDQCLHGRLDEALRIGSICRKTLPLLDQIASDVQNQVRVNTAIARLDELRQELAGFDETYRLLATLTQRSEQRRFLADRRIHAAVEAAMARQQRQVERDLANVSAMEDACADLAAALTSLLTDSYHPPPSAEYVTTTQLRTERQKVRTAAA